MSSPGTDLMPNGRDLLDDHATPGYSRLTKAHWQPWDSPGELPKIAGCCYLPLLSLHYNDDYGDDIRYWLIMFSLGGSLLAKYCHLFKHCQYHRFNRHFLVSFTLSYLPPLVLEENYGGWVEQMFYRLGAQLTKYLMIYHKIIFSLS